MSIEVQLWHSLVYARTHTSPVSSSFVVDDGDGGGDGCVEKGVVVGECA